MYTYKFSIAELNFRVESEVELELSRSVLSPYIENAPDAHTVTLTLGSKLEGVGEFFAEDMGKRFFRTDNGVSTLLIDPVRSVPSLGTVTSPTRTEAILSPEYLIDGRRISCDTLLSALDLPFILLENRRLILHAASISHGGAILFSAPSGTGKSTQAALWEKHRGAIQLNGDKVAVGCREDRAFAYAFPFCGTSGICRDYALPIEAIVFLRQAHENKLETLRGAAALRMIMNNSFGHLSLPGYLERMFDAASSILTSTRVFLLSCTPDERAVELLERSLIRSFSNGEEK